MFDKTEFYRAFGDYAGIPADWTIESVSEENTSTGYCETCYYEYVATYVAGTDAEGNPFYQEVYASLSDFVNSL